MTSLMPTPACAGVEAVFRELFGDSSSGQV